MRRRPLRDRNRALQASALALVLGACSPLPDTVGEAAPDWATFSLVEVNDAPAPWPATLRLANDGRVIGSTPCGTLSARQAAPLPWVEFTEFQTPFSCADRTAERAFVALLSAMDFAEVAGDSLLLTNVDGQTLFFRAAGLGS